jgi:hypothetical protein
MTSPNGSSDPGLPAVDEELGPGNEAVVVGSEEDGGAGDVIGIPNMPNRDGKGQAVEFPICRVCDPD